MPSPTERLFEQEVAASPLVVKNDTGTAEMVDPRLLEILVCPESRQPMRAAPAALIERVNVAIAAGQLTSRGGETVSSPIEGGLLREDGRWLYPVREDIPILLIDEAISVHGIQDR